MDQNLTPFFDTILEDAEDTELGDMHMHISSSYFVVNYYL